MSQQPLFGWIAISERAPTSGDCDKCGDLWLWMPAYEKAGPQIGTLHDIHKATHWQKLEDAWKVPSSLPSDAALAPASGKDVPGG